MLNSEGCGKMEGYYFSFRMCETTSWWVVLGIEMFLVKILPFCEDTFFLNRYIFTGRNVPQSMQDFRHN